MTADRTDADPSAKSALIIGVSGQDGGYLARRLIAEGYRVIGTSRNVNGSSFRSLDHFDLRDRIVLEDLDPCDGAAIRTLIERHDPREIYNLSGQSSVGLSFAEPALTYESIVTSNMVILEQLRLHYLHVRFYNAGSSEMFGGTTGELLNEESRFAPASPYGAAKSSAYWLVSAYRKSFGLFAVTGILFNHESPFRGVNFVTQKVIRAAYEISRGRADELTLGDLSIWRDWGWAGDYVDAMHQMLQQDVPQDFVIATGEAMQLRDFVAYVFDHFGLDWQNFVISSAELARPNELSYSCGDASKARRELGWQPRYTGKAVIEKLCSEYEDIFESETP